MATSTKTQQSILNQPITTANPPISTATTGNKAPYFEASWPIEYLAQMFDRADPIADKIVQLLYEEGRRDALISGNPVDRPRRAFQFLNLLINRMSIPDPEIEHPFIAEDPTYTFSPEVREALRAFMREAQKMPKWADFDLIRQAQALFKANPLLAYPMLAFLSLPVLYTCGRGGTPVLILTEQISVKVRRRIVETGSLIMQVMQRDSFTKLPEHPTLTNPVPVGIEAIIRVRLLHAASRTIINCFWEDGIKDRAAEANKPADVPTKVRNYQGKPADQIWRKEWGQPINQQYLAGVLMSFSYLDLYGLEKVGVIVTDEEKKAYMHLWNVFGYVLGVEEDALLRLDFPRTGAAVYKDGKAVHDASGEEMVATGRAIYTRVLQLNRATDEQGVRDGRILTRAISDYLADLLKRRLPWAKFLRVDRLPYLMMAMMLSKDDRDLLNVKPTLIDRMVFPIVLFVLRIRGIVAKTVGLPASAFANLLFHYMEDENNTVYEELEKQTGIRYPGIPAEFQEQWGTVKK
jgi:hypothetical protein